MIRDELVLLFLEKSRVGYARYPDQVPPPEYFDIARRLVDEEVNKEFLPNLERCRQSWTTENVSAMLDDIVDSIYVLVFAAHKFGLPLEDAWNRVCEANLEKVRHGVVKDEGGKIQKPPGWKPPNIWELVEACFQNSQRRWNFERPMNAPRPEDYPETAEEMLKRKVQGKTDSIMIDAIKKVNEQRKEDPESNS